MYYLQYKAQSAVKKITLIELDIAFQNMRNTKCFHVHQIHSNKDNLI